MSVDRQLPRNGVDDKVRSFLVSLCTDLDPNPTRLDFNKNKKILYYNITKGINHVTNLFQSPLAKITGQFRMDTTSYVQIAIDKLLYLSTKIFELLLFNEVMKCM